MQIADDGGRSWNDFVSRPIATEVVDGVFISNLAGAKEALAGWQGVQVLNLCRESLSGADNDHAVEDSKDMTRAQAAAFVKAGTDRLEEIRRESPVVVVNCAAGINRSSAVVAYWLIRHRRMSAKAALALIKKKKAAEARRLRFKNRFQSHTKPATADRFSWPTLVGGASAQFRAVLDS